MSNEQDTFKTKVGDMLEDILESEHVLRDVNLTVTSDGDMSEVLTDAIKTLKKRGRPKKDTGPGPQNALEEVMFKLRKKLGEGLIEELEALDEGGLRSRIVSCEMNMHETEQAKSADDNLRDLEEQTKNAKAPYTDAIKHQKQIARYCACLREKAGRS